MQTFQCSTFCLRLFFLLEDHLFLTQDILSLDQFQLLKRMTEVLLYNYFYGSWDTVLILVNIIKDYEVWLLNYETVHAERVLAPYGGKQIHF